MICNAADHLIEAQWNTLERSRWQPLVESERGYNRIEVPESYTQFFSDESVVKSEGPTFFYKGRPQNGILKSYPLLNIWRPA